MNFKTDARGNNAGRKINLKQISSGALLYPRINFAISSVLQLTLSSAEGGCDKSIAYQREEPLETRVLRLSLILSLYLKTGSSYSWQLFTEKLTVMSLRASVENVILGGARLRRFGSLNTPTDKRFTKTPADQLSLYVLRTTVSSVLNGLTRGLYC